MPTVLNLENLSEESLYLTGTSVHSHAENINHP